MSLSHLVVLIPAHNEEKLLSRCLHSVLEACSLLPAAISYDIVVAVDASTDKTHEIAEDMLLGHGAVVVTDAGCVGLARTHAAEAALRRYQGADAHCWLANTDADCIVPRNWLLDQIALADSGFHAVAGIVHVDSFTEHAPGVEFLFRRSYLIHADGTHPHVHGANLGVRADAYRSAGGWSALTTAEDHDLWKRLQEVGARRASTARLCVTTSGRRVGRAPHGFAAALASHNSTAHNESRCMPVQLAVPESA